MFAYFWVDLYLHSFNVRTMLRVDARNLGVNKYAAVARRLAFELEAQRKILICLFCSQVTVLVSSAFAEDCSLLDDPLLIAILLPPRERSEEHTSELQSRVDVVCRLL